MAVKDSEKEKLRETTAEKREASAPTERSERDGATEKRRNKSLSDLYTLGRTTDVVREEIKVLKGVKKQDLEVKDNGDGTYDVVLKTKSLRLQKNLLIGETDPRKCIADPQVLRVLESKGADTKEYMAYIMPMMKDINKFLLELFVSTVIIADNDKTQEFGARFKTAIEENGGGIQALQAFMSGLNNSGLLFKDMLTLVDDRAISAMAGMSKWAYASSLDVSLGGKSDDNVELKNGSTIIMDTDAINSRNNEDNNPAIFDRDAISKITPRIRKLPIRD